MMSVPCVPWGITVPFETLRSGRGVRRYLSGPQGSEWFRVGARRVKRYLAARAGPRGWLAQDVVTGRDVCVPAR